MTESTHEVKTKKGFYGWVSEKIAMPKNGAAINQWRCSICERTIFKVWDGNKLIYKFG